MKRKGSSSRVASDRGSSQDVGSTPTPYTRFPELPPLWVLEQEEILDRLSLFDGHRTAAADSLGISVRTMRNKLTIYRNMGIYVMPPIHLEGHGENA